MVGGFETDPNIPSPPMSVFGDRDVSDIQGSVRVLNTRVDNLENNKADKTDVLNLKSEWRGQLLTIIVPLLAALLGAGAILIVGLFAP